MKKRVMWQKFKNFGSFCVIMLLLPYVVTVFVHGKDFEAAGNKEEIFVNVKKKEETEVIQVPWEEYFIGIIGREVPVDAEMEFLKAQAVLLRTKLYQELDSQAKTGQVNSASDESESAAPDESNSAPTEKRVLDEQFLTREELEKKTGTSEIEPFYNKLLQAMQETENQVLFFQDTYALVPFHQSSNGMTRSAQEVLGADTYPYLAVRECPLDKEANDEMQITTFEYKDVQAKCQPFLVAVAEEDADKIYEYSDFEIISHDSAGYVTQMRIGETICTGDQFRDALSLASSAFSIKDGEGKLRITTMGKGHGLGLSQWTAQQMAKAGNSYEEILQFFFEGTTLTDGGSVAEKLE